MAIAPEMTDTTLAVLAGGAGRRMGMPKSHLTIAGRPILQWLAESLQWRGPSLLVTSPQYKNPPGADAFSREVTDPVAEGPLRGVLTALEICQTSYLAIIPVDMLGLKAEHLEWLVRSLVDRAELLGLMPRRFVAGQLQIEPLPLVCRRGARSAVAELWNSGNRAMRSLAEITEFGVIEVPSDWSEEIWTNLNTPEEYARFVAQRLS
jgi:molybdopterin-guanine dinucleotide biosynthesis protein A